MQVKDNSGQGKGEGRDKGGPLHVYQCTGADDLLKPRTSSATVWRCGGGMCIKAHGRCDGVPTCHDKSDEKECLSNVYVLYLVCILGTHAWCMACRQAKGSRKQSVDPKDILKPRANLGDIQ